MARVSPTNPSLLNLKCHEYCGGTPAVCYCPQCAAIFCDACYVREHRGSERKLRHDRLLEVRPICQDHQHTLEYFDLTALKSLCVICKKNVQSNAEQQHHVIENIEAVPSKLRSLLKDRVASARVVHGKINEGIVGVRNTAQNTAQIAVNEVHNVIRQCKDVLDEREVELQQSIQNCLSGFLDNQENVELRSLEKQMGTTVEQAEGVIHLRDSRAIGVNFQQLYAKLHELCSTATTNKLASPRDLKLTINLSRSTLRRIRQLMEVVSSSAAFPEDEENEDLLCEEFLRVKLVDESRPLSTWVPPPVDSSTATSTHHNCDQSFKTPSSTPIQTPQACSETQLAATTIRSQPSVSSPIWSEVSSSGISKVPEAHGWSAVKPMANRCHDDPDWEEDCSRKTPKGTRAVTRAGSSNKSIRGKKRGQTRLFPSFDEPSPKRTLRPRPLERTPEGCRARSQRGGELSKEMNKCDIILTELWANEESWPFVRPVDRRQFPEYYKKIVNPLDLSIVKDKLHTYQYRSVMDFVRDMKLIFSNCKAFNKPGSDILEGGLRLEQHFSSLLHESFPNFENVFQSQELMDSSL